MYQMKGAATVKQADARVIVNGYWKCGSCGRNIQKQMSSGDHKLISHRFGEYNIGRR